MGTNSAGAAEIDINMLFCYSMGELNRKEIFQWQQNETMKRQQ